MNALTSSTSAPARARRLLSMLAASLLMACTSSYATQPTASACALTPPSGTMTAQVGGVPFTSNLLTRATVAYDNASERNTILLSGTGCVVGTQPRTHFITISVGRQSPITVGTYQLSAAAQGVPTGSGYIGLATYMSASNIMHYSNRGSGTGAGSGSITFTTISATRVTGTFTLVLEASPANGAATGELVTVTNGVFDIPR